MLLEDLFFELVFQEMFLDEAPDSICVSLFYGSTVFAPNPTSL